MSHESVTAESVVCAGCQKEFPKADCQTYVFRDYCDGHWQDKAELYCQPCFDTRFAHCSGCEEYCPLDDILHDAHGQAYCDNCYNDAFTHCCRCDYELYTEDASYDEDGNAFCDSCYEQPPDHPATLQLIVKEELSQKESLKLFGLEIEAIVKGSSEYDNFYSLRHFSVVDDGSLNTQGMEFVSVPMPAGRQGYQVLHDFSHAYAHENLTVDKSCGLHLHLNITEKDLTLRNLKKLWIAYLKLEPYFLRLVPFSRRENHFCQKMHANYSIESVRKFRKESKLLSYYYGELIGQRAAIPKDKYHSKRYYWLNLHSLFYRGTLEIRLHSGTISSRKMVYWIRLHRRLLKWVLHRKTTMRDVLSLDKEKLFAIVQDAKIIRYLMDREAKFLPHARLEELFAMFPLGESHV
ncbi:amidoligase family protein [Candidatus Acetothermia bacterium]|nr:amidoligase family protein [Candidatus Acetothermia bacterium]